MPARKSNHSKPLPKPESQADSKRRLSPGSYFFHQGRSIVLASQYYSSGRLSETCKGAVAAGHHNTICVALFGQLMASFEDLSKEVVARSVDIADYLDLHIAKCDWIKISTPQVLSIRGSDVSVGTLLIGPTQGWHSAEALNNRYVSLFGGRPVPEDAIDHLNRLWIMRHTVAHNAGRVTHHDAARMAATHLSDRVLSVDAKYIADTFLFLRPIAESMVQMAHDRYLSQFLSTLDDHETLSTRQFFLWESIKHLGLFLDSRSKRLPLYDMQEFRADSDRYRQKRELLSTEVPSRRNTAPKKRSLP